MLRLNKYAFLLSSEISVTERKWLAVFWGGGFLLLIFLPFFSVKFQSLYLEHYGNVLIKREIYKYIYKSIKIERSVGKKTS